MSRVSENIEDIRKVDTIEATANAAEVADSTILKESEIIDTLTSTSTIAPLSANMGKSLKDTADNHSHSDLDSVDRWFRLRTDYLNYAQLIFTSDNSSVDRGSIVMGDSYISINDASSFSILRHNLSTSELNLYAGGQIKLTTKSTGVDVTGDITLSGTVDGRDIAVDGAKTDLAVTSDNTETGTDKILNMVSCTQAEYDALTPVATTFYAIVG